MKRKNNLTKISKKRITKLGRQHSLFRLFSFTYSGSLFICFFVYSFSFIGSPQQSISPTQPVAQLSSLHSLITLSSSPHFSQTRVWPSLSSLQFINITPQYMTEKVCNLGSKYLWNNISEDLSWRLVLKIYLEDWSARLTLNKEERKQYW